MSFVKKKRKKQSKSKKQSKWKLHLYVCNTTPRSMLAIANLDALCAQYLQQAYNVRIIDIVKDPAAATRANVLAVPTLVRVSPGPAKRVIGSLSDTQAVLRGIDLGGQVLQMPPLSSNPGTVIQKIGAA